jgi:excisionase family DNA binding protein
LPDIGGDNMRTEERLSLQDAAEALGISEQTARRWVKTGKLKAYKPGLRYLIPASAISELLEVESAPKASSRLSHAAPEEANGEELRVDSEPPVTVYLKPLELRGELKKADIAQILKSVAAGEISVEAGVEEVWKRFAA